MIQELNRADRELEIAKITAKPWEMDALWYRAEALSVYERECYRRLADDYKAGLTTKAYAEIMAAQLNKRPPSSTPDGSVESVQYYATQSGKIQTIHVRGELKPLYKELFAVARAIPDEGSNDASPYIPSDSQQLSLFESDNEFSQHMERLVELLLDPETQRELKTVTALLRKQDSKV
jgi:hypothetical protein